MTAVPDVPLFSRTAGSAFIAALLATARTAGSAFIAGGISGLVVGGILGRLAMRLLALTSPEVARGRLTDDGARVGEFTVGGSFTLAVSLGVVGAVLGLAYPLARRALPTSRPGRIAGYALLTGTLGSTLLVHDHPSFDYSILQPTWLAVTCFVLLPAGYGALVALITEALTTHDRPRFPGALSRWWHSGPLTVAARTAYWILVAWGAYNLGADIISVASDRASNAPFTI